jgi:hypothetical protein
MRDWSFIGQGFGIVRVLGVLEKNSSKTPRTGRNYTIRLDGQLLSNTQLELE